MGVRISIRCVGALFCPACFPSLRLSSSVQAFILDGLPGVPSRYFDDPKEAEEAMLVAKEVIDPVRKEFT